MNVAFFLTPKSEVAYLTHSMTMRQALEKMQYHRYTAVPLLDKAGRYTGTLTEGDLLWYLKDHPEMSFKDTHKVRLRDIPRRIHNTPVPVDADILDLVELAMNQNFVPVIDDTRVFIGIVKRSDIISYCAKVLDQKVESSA
jgi:CBS domain-containing protein